ncbi:MAG TPA: ABC transporter permease [Planctomycetes bacterium]|nr:ABC transporter permease [Planctomycetota bacterium]
MPDPDRFQTARSTLLVDRFMTSFIKVGGLAIIAAVFGIFVFILLEILPLFQQAQVRPTGERQGPQVESVALGVDEWGELPFLLASDGTLHLLPASGAGSTVRLLPDGEQATASDYDQEEQSLVIGTSLGRVLSVDLNYSSELLADGARRIAAKPAVIAEYAIGEPGKPIVGVALGDSSEAKMLAVLQDGKVHASMFEIGLAALGGSAGKAEKLWSKDVTALLPAPPERILVDDRGESLVAADSQGRITVLQVDGEDMVVFQQPFKPFADLVDPRIASIDFLFGDVSLVLTAPSGENRIFSLFIDPTLQKRQYGKTKDLPPLKAGANAYAHSVRNKSFLLADGHEASLRFATAATVRWQGAVDYDIRDVAISGKYDRIFLLDEFGKLHDLALNDPHPESGFRAFFGKVWYEGGDGPEYSWQSSGSTDDFEPKLSVIPLIVGTLKGTFYAMLLAVPIALLAAIYTAEFMRPAFKIWVKPTMEVMASLPSVVLGFLAALWLAPLLEDRVPAILCCIVGLPLSALGFGLFWSRLPDHIRSRIRPGYEFLAFLPVMAIALYISWSLGRPIEALLFGGDFRAWWPQATGASFEQRNSLVVGFMMGFAVIPILFTIVEDALSNVPAALRSGSLALGASRWQTAMRIVVPTASAGILSAIMIGLGRAVGETMIVVMATGNTPVMDMNIFNGMRTLSANIAVELPEAPHGGTLYRALFLGAMLLFLMTFLVNTCAEVLRQHLREKYKTV